MPTIKNRLFRYLRKELYTAQLYDHKIFPVLAVISAVLAVTVWWGVHSSIQQNADEPGPHHLSIYSVLAEVQSY